MRVLLVAVTFACLACDSMSGAPPMLKTRAPDLDCASCYVVNAALATHGQNVFVGGYAADTNHGVLRVLAGDAWENVELGSSVSAIRQMSAAEHVVYLATNDQVVRWDVTSHALASLEVDGSLVWASAGVGVAVFDQAVMRRADGDNWTDLPTGVGKPKAVAGSALGDLYVLDDQGEIAHASDDGFTPLSERAPVHVTSIAVAGDKLLAVSGDDHDDGKTGPGAILSFSDGHWSTLVEAPGDALLGIASHDQVIYAVGATRRGDDAIPIAWHFDGAHWHRHALVTNNAFLWSVACTDDGVCYASGTDNTFVELSLFD